jgi:transcriptional regulator GlxA family with amidase domain
MIGTLLTFSAMSELLLRKAPAPFDLKNMKVLRDLRALPEAEASRAAAAKPPGRVAVILMSNTGTEVSELLGAYEILAESGEFDVFTAAPQRVLSGTTSDLAVVPRTTLAEAPEADLLVIPAVLDQAEPELAEFVARRAGHAKLVLALGEGARVLAHAGLLRGAQATSHFIAVPELRKLEPKTDWIRGPRYVLDGQSGKMLTSVGVSSTMDAALFAIERIAGEPAARRTAERLSYRWVREGGETAADPAVAARALNERDLAALFLHGGYDWDKRQAGVLVYPGISELSLASVLDTFPRTLDTRVTTLAAERVVIMSRHGLELVAASRLDDALTTPDLLVVPSGMGPQGTPPPVDPLKDETVHHWIVASTVPVKSFLYEAPGKAFDESLRLLGELEQRPGGILRFVEKMIEYPSSEPAVKPPTPVWPSGQLIGGLWPPPLWVKPLVIGIFGVMLAAWLDRRLRMRLAAARPKRR